MAEKNKETAEQKLLKMIEASSGASSASDSPQAKTVRKQNVLSVVKAVNKFLFVAVIFGLLLFANEVRSGLVLLSQNPEIRIEEMGSVTSVGNSSKSNAQRLSYYLADVKQRNIFLPYDDQVSSTIVDSGSKDKEIMKKVQDLRLVGISWLDSVDSAAAMIEDKKKDITHFLHKGDQLDDVVIKTIYADGVELGYKNEEIIIRYDKSQM